MSKTVKGVYFGAVDKDHECRAKLHEAVAKDYREWTDKSERELLTPVIGSAERMKILDLYESHSEELRFFANALACMVSPITISLYGTVKDSKKDDPCFEYSKKDVEALGMAAHLLWQAGRFLGAIYDQRDDEYHERLKKESIKLLKKRLSRYETVEL